MKPRLFVLLGLMLTTSLPAQSHWESLVKNGDTYKYLRATANPAVNWYTSAFSDASWPSAKSSIGFGYDDSTTVAWCRAIYLRRKFTINDLSVVKNILFEIDYDDAFVAYLNGVEIARSANILSASPGFNASLNPGRQAQMPLGRLPERFAVRNNNLVKGENLLAIQVINGADTSRSLTVRAWLQAEIQSSYTTYSSIPSWFVPPPVVIESKIPLLIIDTQGMAVNADKKVTARMFVVDQTDGKLNHPDDSLRTYDGYVGIKKRGESSLYFAKNNYGLETRDAFGNNLNVSLLGLPAENDWVLNGPYSDKSLVRNALSFHLAQVTKEWNPRTRFCELLLNGRYEGVYVLMEKIKVDSQRVDIADLLPTDLSGDELTGGYLLRVDKDDVAGQYFNTGISYAGIPSRNLQYFEPESAVLADVQKTYIRNFMTAFETALTKMTYADPASGYHSFIDVSSFVDYFLLNELAMDVDNYKYSTYLYKEKDSKGGKLFAGPIWDDDLGYGNANFWMYGSTGISWMFNYEKNDRLFWWKRLREDTYFRNLTRTRWEMLRETCWSNANLMATIDSMVLSMGDAVVRNFHQWPTIGTYVWPNVYVGSTYQADKGWLKQWLTYRLKWMEESLPGTRLIPMAELTVSDSIGKTLRLRLTQDYFSKPLFKKKQLKWIPGMEGPEIDTILCESRSQALIRLKGSVFDTYLPQGLALRLDKKMVEGFSDVVSTTLVTELKSTFVDLRPSVQAFYEDHQMVICTNIPQLLDSDAQIFDYSGRKVAEARLEQTAMQRISIHLNKGMYLLRLSYDGNPLSLRLMIR